MRITTPRRSLDHVSSCSLHPVSCVITPQTIILVERILLTDKGNPHKTRPSSFPSRQSTLVSTPWRTLLPRLISTPLSTVCSRVSTVIRLLFTLSTISCLRSHRHMLFLLVERTALISVRGNRPGKAVQLHEYEIKYLCTKAREIFINQPILLELEAPIKICGKWSTVTSITSGGSNTDVRRHSRAVL